jgi:AmmeMemoRadiSam system protein B
MFFRPVSGLVTAFGVLVALAACKSAPAPPAAAGADEKTRTVKTTNVAGAFYPADKDALESGVESYYEAVKVGGEPGNVVAVFTPHAGYDYSGLIAAVAFGQLGARKPATFVILAPSHHVGPEGGVAAPTYDAFATPLGEIAVDKPLVAAISGGCDAVVANDAAFAKEHAVEVQLPFIRVLNADARVAPFIFCRQDDASATAFGKALAAAVKGREDVVIVCTCDLSHYHPYDEARALDAAFVATFERFDAAAVFAGDAAGTFEIDAPGPVAATFVAARELGAAKAVPLVQRNSGDVTGDKSEGVVGYFAAVVTR